MREIIILILFVILLSGCSVKNFVSYDKDITFAGGQGFIVIQQMEAVQCRSGKLQFYVGSTNYHMEALL